MSGIQDYLLYVVNELGQPIHPIHEIVRSGQCSCGNAECKNKGKHPRTPYGVKDATRDWDIIGAWLTQWPTTNWAIALDGDLFAVDVDPRHHGEESLKAWEAKHGRLPDTFTAITGGGGNHYFYRVTGSALGNRNNWLPGVDVKGKGGYVVMPPSNHESGGYYQWREPVLKPVLAPLVLIESLQNYQSEQSSLANSASILDGIAEGERDTTLFRWACRLRRQHSTDADGGRAVVSRLVLDAAANCWPPFPRSEALRKVEQAYLQDHEDVTDAQRAWAALVTKGGVSPAERESRVKPGGTFILDEPAEIPAIWGDGERVLWAEGEALMITGHQGVGKTTIGQQLVLARLGIRDGGLLGLPVSLSTGRVLYLAMDRPRQAARSFRRMVSESDRDVLNSRLVVWRGPLPRSPLDHVASLADLIQEVCPGVDTVVVDSVKDLAPGISKDEVGAALNSAWQEVIARDVDLLLLHHERKAGSDAKRTHKLDDVYGSTWLTSGLGSVVVLNGEPGDPTVELVHLKQPADPVGPLTIRHDHGAGRSIALDAMPTVAELVNLAGDAGVTKLQVAMTVYGRSQDADLQRAGRELAKLVKADLVQQVKGARTANGAEPDRWVATSTARWASHQSS
jgi:replicative DNA helicase